MITTCPRRPFEGGSRHERNIDEVGDSEPIRVYVGHGHSPGAEDKVAHLQTRRNIPAAMLRRVGRRHSNGAAEPEQPGNTMEGAPVRGQVRSVGGRNRPRLARRVRWYHPLAHRPWDRREQEDTDALRARGPSFSGTPVGYPTQASTIELFALGPAMQ